MAEDIDMNLIYTRAAIVAVVTLLAFFSVHAATEEPRTIRGTILDDSGAAIPNARVTLRNAAGATLQMATGDGAGAFTITGVTPGRYHLQAEASLFQAVT